MIGGELVAFGSLKVLQLVYGKVKYELKFRIRLQEDTIEQLKFEHDFKKKMKIKQDNFASVLK